MFWSVCVVGKDLEPFPVDVAYISGIKRRLSLAKEIDKEELKLV